MIPLANTLPTNSNDGVVAAAYIVFFAIVLIYVAIMAIRLSRVERQLSELRRDENTTGNASDGESSIARGVEGPTGSQRERETV